MDQQQNQQGTTTIAEPPFKIRFSYGGKSVDISLLMGNDVFKLAEIFQNILSENGIQFDVEHI